MGDADRGLSPVLAVAAAAGGAAGWLLVLVEEGRCTHSGLGWLVALALLLTLAPAVTSLVRRTAWWVGVLATGVLLLALLAVFRPGGVYDCAAALG